MRVVHVYRTYFPDPPGGLQEAIRQICLGTQVYGVEARVFTLSPKPEPSVVERNEAQVVRSRSWAAPASCDLGGLDAWVKFNKLLAWADVVHYHFPWPFGDFLRLTSLSHKPSVLTYHSDVVRQKALGYAYAPLMRKMLNAMSFVVATSPAYAQTSPVLTKHVPPNRLRVIPLGIADFADQSLPGDFTDRWGLDEPFLLALGVLRYYKGLDTLLTAAKDIQGKVVIAGSGPEETALKNQAAALGLNNVVFAGQVSVEEKIYLLRSCRALVLPSHLRSEAFGMVLVEASMFAKPMVSCELGTGTSYVNAHDETGFVVPPENPRMLAEVCNRLLMDDNLAHCFGLRARKRYETLFSGKATGKSYFDLYQQSLVSR